MASDAQQQKTQIKAHFFHSQQEDKSSETESCPQKVTFHLPLKLKSHYVTVRWNPRWECVPICVHSLVSENHKRSNLTMQRSERVCEARCFAACTYQHHRTSTFTCAWSLYTTNVTHPFICMICSWLTSCWCPLGRNENWSRINLDFLKCGLTYVCGKVEKNQQIIQNTLRVNKLPV